jgi:Xaa-Pro aminopeptidase
MRSGRRDEDVDREVAFEPRETLERFRPERGLAPACLDDRADQRAELVAPGKSVVAQPDVLAFRQDGDRRIALESVGLFLDAIGHALRELGQSGHDPLRLGAEVDVAGAGKRRLLRPVGNEQLDGSLQRVEKITHLSFVLRPEDRHRADYRIRAVADVLILADSTRSPEMRHEVPVAIPDSFLYAETNGRRAVVVSSLEAKRIAEADPGLEVIPLESLGVDELLASGTKPSEVGLQAYTRACRELGIASASVPPTFPLELADRLRDNGIEVRVDREHFDERRRRKNATEIAGLRRAQRACEAALDVAREMLRGATINGTLMLEGEPLTSERIKAEVERVFGEHGAYADEFIVSHGPQTAIGHESGHGPILAGEPISFDLFPKDRATGVYTDMTRTYVVGDIPDELREYHRLCKEALDRVVAAAKPGVNGRALFQITCDLFAEHGYPTQLTKQPGEVLDSGFFHSLGHGVGLEVHERPWLGRVGDDLVPGDVIALEPGLYRAGFGGVRLEDIAIVTEDGIEVVTSYPYELEP